METPKLISDMLAVAIVVMMAIVIAGPVGVLILQDTEDRQGRWRSGFRRRLLEWFKPGLDKGPRRHGAHRAPVLAGGVKRAGAEAAGPVSGSGPGWVPPRPGRAAPPPTLAHDRRRQKRFKTCFLGTLHRSSNAEAEHLCDILDLSAGGARVRPVDPMLPRRRMALGLRHFGCFPARVVWRRGDELGLKFEQDPSQIMEALKGFLPSSAFPHVQTAEGGAAR